jgi:hypothetical protein
LRARAVGHRARPGLRGGRRQAGRGPFIAGVTAELERRCPPDLGAALVVVAGELDDAERYGALAAADAHAAALVSETSFR